jgi:glyoxylase-like metal-dependent hydrolase (beta-lactamase superfamily II)
VIHHLNCASLRPLLGPSMVAHVLLVERPDGLLLVDSGFGTADLADPRRLGRPFRAITRPALDPDETAVARIRALGLDPADVTDIAMTHLDLDHAGGLADFPQARVHVYDAELEAALDPPTAAERTRYLAAQWAHGPRWVRHRASGDEWFGFSAVTALSDDVVLVPLHGHSRGHAGVAVRRPADDGGGWLLHAGDSYFSAGEKRAPRTCPATLRAFQTVVAQDNRQRLLNQERLRELVATHSDEVSVFCAHDAPELAALAALPAR